MTKSLALGCAAGVTGLGSGAGCICPVVTKSLALGCATTLTGLGSGAGCICPVVRCKLAVGLAAAGAYCLLSTGCFAAGMLASLLTAACKREAEANDHHEYKQYNA